MKYKIGQLLMRKTPEDHERHGYALIVGVVKLKDCCDYLLYFNKINEEKREYDFVMSEIYDVIS